MRTVCTLAGAEGRVQALRLPSYRLNTLPLPSAPLPSPIPSPWSFAEQFLLPAPSPSQGVSLPLLLLMFLRYAIPSTLPLLSVPPRHTALREARQRVSELRAEGRLEEAPPARRLLDAWVPQLAGRVAAAVEKVRLQQENVWGERAGE